MEEVKKPTTISWRNFERQNDDVKTKGILRVPLARIKVKPGFNPRDIEKPDTQEKITRLQAAYEAGHYVPEILVRLKNNEEVEIVDGHCRNIAANRANDAMLARGEIGIATLTVIPFEGNDRQALVHTVTGNDGEKLLPIEIAEVVARLTQQGLDAEEIAKLFSYSVGWVNKLKFMSTMPEEVKTMVKTKVVSADVAVEQVKTLGDEAAPVLKEMVAQVKEEHEAKPESKDKPAPTVTTKTVKAQKEKAAPKAEPKKPNLETNVFLQVRLATLALKFPEEISNSVFIREDSTEEYNVVMTASTLKLFMKLKETFTEKSDV